MLDGMLASFDLCFIYVCEFTKLSCYHVEAKIVSVIWIYKKCRASRKAGSVGIPDDLSVTDVSTWGFALAVIFPKSQPHVAYNIVTYKTKTMYHFTIVFD